MWKLVTIELAMLKSYGGKINLLVQSFAGFKVLFADTAAHKAALWKIRRTIGESVKLNAAYKKEDMVVPRAELPALIKAIKQIGAKYGFDSVCFGHAGDGNMHLNIVKGSMSDRDWQHKLDDGIYEIFQLTVCAACVVLTCKESFLTKSLGL